MAKNLVFLADGTGNDSDIESATNVYKLYQRLRNDLPGHPRMLPGEIDKLRTDTSIEQITQYDPGVGSRPLDLVGKATGKGISKNVKDGYEFFCRFYEPGDRIYLFGFSRGAYTVRSLGGLIGLCGIPKRQQGEDGDLLHDEKLRLGLVDEAFGIYRTMQGEGEAGQKLRREKADIFIANYGHPDSMSAAVRAPYLIGIWDTVRSLGWPTQWRDVELPGQSNLFHDHDLNPFVRYAFHALSIDDQRSQFYPTIWNEPTLAKQGKGLGDDQTFFQVWFPGVHADVGGGYPETGLSDLSLRWMIDRIRTVADVPKFYGNYETKPYAGLRGDVAADPHDPRDTLWKKLVYTVRPRDVVRGFQAVGERQIKPLDLPEQAHIHRCSIERITARRERGDYPPKVLAEHSDIVLALKQIKESLPPDGPFSYIFD